MDLFVFLPCYNEELNITELIQAWNDQKDALSDLGYSLIIYAIDDCSIDSTKQKITDMTSAYENVNLIEHTENKGLCGGLNTAIAHFLEFGNDNSLMVLMDGDNTHNPKYIFDMISKVDKFDCIIASRYCKNSNTVGVAAHRTLLSDLARFYYKFLLRVPNVEDYTCGYRVYSYCIIKKMVENFGVDPIKEKSFACMMELLYKCYLSGATFDEIGFELRYDYKKGESKIALMNTIRNSLITALKLSRQRKV